MISLPLALWLAALGIALWEGWLEGTVHTPLTSGPFPTASSIFWGLIAAINAYTTGMSCTFRRSNYKWGVFTPHPM
jgi:hypothetical protein